MKRYLNILLFICVTGILQASPSDWKHDYEGDDRLNACNLFLNITPTNTTICPGESITLTANATTNGPQGGTYRFIWSVGPPQNGNSSTSTNTVTPTSPTTYVVSARYIKNSDTCYDSKSVFINLFPEVSPSISPSQNYYCYNDMATLTANAQVGGILSYAWSTNANTQSITPTFTTNTTYRVTVTKNSNQCSGVATLPITVSNPIVSVNQGSTVPCENDLVDLQATITGGIGPFTYTWRKAGVVIGNINPMSVTAQDGDVYTVVITDSKGCEATASLTLNASQNPIINSVTIPTEICEDVAFQFCANVSGGVAPYTYYWSTGATTLSNCLPLTGSLSISLYSVTVTSSQGCEAVQSRSISVNPKLVVSSMTLPDPICPGVSFDVCVNTNGGTGSPNSFIYQWSPNRPQGASYDCIRDISVTGNSTYQVTVTDNKGCIASSSISQVGHQEALVDIQLIGQSGSVCIGEQFTLEANQQSGSTPPTYLWSDGSVTESIIITAASTTPSMYWVTLTDANGCINVDSIAVTILDNPVGTIGSLIDTACINGQIKLNTNVVDGIPPYTFDWSSGGSGDSTIVIPNGLGSTIYAVTVTDSNGCFDVASETIVVTDTFSVVISGQSICVNNTPAPLVATVTGGVSNYTINWFESSDGVVFGPMTTCTTNSCTIVNAITSDMYYKAVVSNAASGCDPVETVVKVEAGIVPAPSISGDLSVCKGQRSLFVAELTDDDNSLTWEIPDTTGIESILQEGELLFITWNNNPGTYSIFLNEFRGQNCYGIDTLDVVVTNGQAPPAAEIEYMPINNFLYYNDSTVNCFQWGRYRPGLNINETLAGEVYQSYRAGNTYDTTYTYWVRVSYDSTCSASSCYTTVHFEDRIIPLDSIEGSGAITVYPNPNTGVFTVLGEYLAEANYTVSVVNLLGQEVYHKSHVVKDSRWEVPIDLKSMASGLYYVRIIKDGKDYFLQPVVVMTP